MTYDSYPSYGAANALQAEVVNRPSLSPDDSYLRDVLAGWQTLSNEIRSLIAATVRAHGRPSIP